MLTITSAIENLPKITKPQIAALKKFGLQTAGDLLFHFPYRYLDFSVTKKISELKAGEAITIKAAIKSIHSRFSFRGRMSLAEAVVSDDSGSIKVVWFNQPYLAKNLKIGDEIFLAGTPEYYNFGLQLTNPIYEKATDFPVHTARLVPVYHLTQSIYPKTFRNFVAQVLELRMRTEDILPADILKRQGLLKIQETILYSHFPESLEQVEMAKKRLAFEEIFLNQLLAQKHKLTLAQKQSFQMKFNQDLIKNFVASLPFELTPGQRKSAWDILQDLEKPAPMNRLLEGDVGSGKTLVALIAAIQSTSDGYQVAFLAPTEILARQHFETAKKYFSSKIHGREFYDIFILTNQYAKTGKKDETKERLAELIRDGAPGLFIGTHALLNKKIRFKNLGLVIVDEQHRFGVDQRAGLMENGSKVPHFLSLTATPIPRTLHLAVFGELDVSTIKTKPAGRKPIITKLVHKDNRLKTYEFIKKQILDGRQAFVITPLIEESDPSRLGGSPRFGVEAGRAEADKLGVKAAKTELENLKKIFPELNIGLMHGRLKGAEKEKVMKDFLENKIHVLVSTSVVEVGVDVPNASVMVIEGAERFGLAQLHQFRGRVGRAEHQSYCLLFTEQENPDVIQRLADFTKTQDGFALAELDLKQRGFGEIYGAQQSGWNFKYFSPTYTELIPKARDEALNLLKKDFDLKNYPLLAEKIAGKTIHFE